VIQHYKHILNTEMEFLKQKSREVWLSSGNSNTTLFRASIQSGNHNTALRSLQNENGVTAYDRKKIG